MKAMKNVHWIGAGLMVPSWVLNWSLSGLRTHLLFFPLWLGFALLLDGLTFARTGSSLLTRSPRRYAGLFLVSAPAWWLFELFNLRTQNWFYLGKESFSSLEYALFATINFSTVMPAVFGAAELYRSFNFIGGQKTWIRVPTAPRSLILYAGIGFVMLALVLGAPRYSYPLLWTSLVFILEPLNYRLGARTLLAELERGDWRPVWSLWLGCLTCGFFWEMWNYLSYPKWIYHTPFVQFAHVFEMPLLGYLGYLPFSMELFALYHLTVRILGGESPYLLLSKN
ncbi:MAG: hypothetical protein ONA69_04060 [candidate division KSB1 bacterium]|nr:hypothetical protein [candidate division KSB1 bacterium]